jgi:hypothetical protein
MRYHPTRLARAIADTGMSAREFSRKTSYCPQSISNWTAEGGQTPKASALGEVCMVLTDNDRPSAAAWLTYILGLTQKPRPS